MTHVGQYIAEQTSPNPVVVNHPGVIGGPVFNSPYKRTQFAPTTVTPTARSPTRRSRGSPSPSHPRSGRREQAKGNFA